MILNSGTVSRNGRLEFHSLDSICVVIIVFDSVKAGSDFVNLIIPVFLLIKYKFDADRSGDV